jgi:hypothetical protein
VSAAAAPAPSSSPPAFVRHVGGQARQLILILAAVL